MDNDMRKLMRTIQRQGRSVELIVELVQELPDTHRRHIDNWLRFFREREQRHWRLGDSYDATKSIFLIKDLPDSTIIRLINGTAGRRHWDHWVRHGKDDSDQYNWNREDHTFGRSTYAVVWEEAEYRGIMSREQLYWEDVLGSKRISVTVFERMIGRCDTRGAHEIVRIGNRVKCADCRKEVSNEEVVKFATAKLRGRLRVTASGVCSSR